MPEPDSEDQEELGEQVARGFWSGTLSFGLVSIPVRLCTARRSRGPGLRMLDQKGTPLVRRYYCPEDGQDLGADDLVRGYQLDSGAMVTVTDEELAALAPQKSRDIDLRLFVPTGSLDPFSYDQSYYLVPAAESTKAYRLLAQTMERTGRVGIATFVMHGNEYLVAIEAEAGVLRAETLHFPHELRPLAELGLPAKHPVNATTVEQYRQAITRLAADELDMNDLRDEGTELLRALAEHKRAQHQDVVEVEEVLPEEPQGAEVIDLMQALKRSLESQASTPERPRAAAERTGRPGLRKAAARPGRAVHTRARCARPEGAERDSAVTNSTPSYSPIHMQQPFMQNWPSWHGMSRAHTGIPLSQV